MKLAPAILGSTLLSLLSSGCHHFSHFSHDSRLVVDGVELESETPHGLEVPVVMDATVEPWRVALRNNGSVKC